MSMPVDSPLGETWGFAQMSNAGKGYYEEAGVGWFDQLGRAHGRFLLTISSGFKGFVAICPPGVKPPQDPMPPSFVQPVQTDDDTDDREEDSELL